MQALEDWAAALDSSIESRAQELAKTLEKQQQDAVARALLEQGVGPGALVADFCDDGPGLVLAILGVLSAGATVVPLDPTQPRARLAALLEDCKRRLPDGGLRPKCFGPGGSPGRGNSSKMPTFSSQRFITLTFNLFGFKALKTLSGMLVPSKVLAISRDK